MNLPPEFLKYLEDPNNIGEGLLGCDPGYFVLWSLQEIEESNRTLGVPSYAPGFIGFGGNGGGEMLAFDEQGAVYMIPLIGMSKKDATKICDNWHAFVEQIGVDSDS